MNPYYVWLQSAFIENLYWLVILSIKISNSQSCCSESGPYNYGPGRQDTEVNPEQRLWDRCRIGIVIFEKRPAAQLPFVCVQLRVSIHMMITHDEKCFRKFQLLIRAKPHQFCLWRRCMFIEMLLHIWCLYFGLFLRNVSAHDCSFASEQFVVYMWNL